MEDAGTTITELEEAVTTDEAVCVDELEVGASFPAWLLATLATLLLAGAMELLDEDLAELLDEDLTEDDSAKTDEDLSVLVGGVELLPPPHALNTTVSDKAVKARSE